MRNSVETVVICLNGPNILDVIQKVSAIHADFICMGSGILNRFIKPKYYFFEPSCSLEHQQRTRQSYDPYNAMFLVLEPLQVNTLVHRSRTENISIIRNPQNLPSYFMMPPSNLKHYIPSKWFYCDESTFISGNRSAQKYLIQECWNSNILLNYRCTLIKAFSLALTLGYRNIYIAGFNPSSPHHWFTNNPRMAAEISHHATDEDILSQIFRGAHRLIEQMPLLNNDDASISSIPEYSLKRIPNIFLSFLSSFYCHCPELSSTMTIKILGDDPDVIAYLKSYRMEELRF